MQNIPIPLVEPPEVKPSPEHILFKKEIEYLVVSMRQARPCCDNKKNFDLVSLAIYWKLVFYSGNYN